MNIRHRLTTASLCLLATLANVSHADIFVDRAIVRLAADAAPREDIKVINNGGDVGYVKVEVFEVRNPGSENEERVKITDPAQMKLIATPSKLVIPANSQKLVRIVSTVAPSEERIYRVNVTPVLPPLQEENSVVRVVVAYQLLVIADPMTPKKQLDVVRNGKTLRVHNQGNTNVLFSDGRQCLPAVNDAEPECKTLTSRRVYPGNVWEIELPLDQPVTFKQTSFEGITETSFD